MTAPVSSNAFGTEVLTSLDVDAPADPLTTYVVRTYDPRLGTVLSPALFGRVGLATKRFEELVTEEPNCEHYLLSRTSKTATVLRHYAPSN